MNYQATKTTTLPIWATIRYWGEKISRYVSYHIHMRRTINELSALSDRTLEDIGISRSEIRAVARSLRS